MANLQCVVSVIIKPEIMVSVDFKPVKTLGNPVTLNKIKETKELQNIAIIKQPRLAVMPITKYEFNTLLHLSNI
jgi:predicted RNA-binding protein with PUA-like domain